MSSHRQRSGSALSNRSDTIGRQQANSSPSPFSQNKVNKVPEDLALNDIPAGANTTSRPSALSVSSGATGSPYPAFGARSVSPGSRPRAHTDQNLLSVGGPRNQAHGNQRMVSSGQIMDSQRPQYIPGPPPLPPSQPSQPHLANLPPPPPRLPPQGLQTNVLPPPPPPPPLSSFPPGTVYGLPAGWQQSWGRPGMPQLVPPPPPPLNQSQSAYGANHMNQIRQPTPLAIPPPPPLNELVSATFIPGGDSFGPGVGIPPLDDSKSSSSYSRQDASAYSTFASYLSHNTNETNAPTYQYNPADHHEIGVPPTPLSRNHHANTFPMPRENHEPRSPASQNPVSQPPHSQSQPDISGKINRQGTAMSPVTGGTVHDVSTRSQSEQANIQWPLKRVLHWLATNGFSSDWQDTFRVLNLHGSEFIDLGRDARGRANLGKMHQVVYPQLANICTHKNKTGWDQNREREEGKRMRKLIRQIVDTGIVDQNAAPPPHRRRESSQMLTSASTDEAANGSPNLGRSDTTATPSTAGPEGSPGNQIPAKLAPAFGPRNSNQQRSGTGQSYSSPGSTPSESSHPENQHSHTRGDLSRSILNALDPRKGRHSPSASGDAATPTSLGVHGKPFEGSPKNGSPALGYVAPVSASSVSPHGHSKNSSIDSRPSRNGFNAPGTGESLRGYIGGAPGEVPMTNRPARPYVSESHRTNSHDREHGKNNFVSTFPFFKRKKHDPAYPSPEEQPLESPTSPINYKMPPSIPYERPGTSGRDSSLGDRPGSKMSDRESSVSRSTRGKDLSSRKYILATTDRWTYRLIDVTDADSAGGLRQAICADLGIAAPEFVQIYFTEAGQQEHEEPLTDAALLLSRRTKADNLGSLKFYVVSSAWPSISLSEPHSAGLGLSIPKPDSSPTTGPFSKPIDRETYLRLVSSAQSGSGSPLGSQESTLKGPISRFYDNGSEIRSAKDELTVVDESISQPEREAALQKAAEEYNRDNERKQRLYQEKRRQTQKQSYTDDTSIHSRSVIDFDSPRASPFEEKKNEMAQLVPQRKPPLAPAESTTLSKVNSLTRRPGERVRTSGHSESFKRKSDPIAEEVNDRGRRRGVVPSSSQKSGLGAALADVGKMMGTPAAVANSSSRTKSERAMKSVDFGIDGTKSSPGGSPKSPSHTWAKGNMLFKVPDYEEDSNRELTQDMPPPLNLPSNAVINKVLKTSQTPSVSPSTETPRQPPLTTRRSYGPNFDFPEQRVVFASSPAPQFDSDSDSDSDDGLFAMPLTSNKSPVPSGRSEELTEPQKSEKPPLSVDTQSKRTSHVRFNSPSTAGGASLGPSSHTPDTDDGDPISGNAMVPSESWFSAQSPNEKTVRRASFASDIWADRPPVEGVIDNLDEFFPNIDLDEPYLEESGDTNQPTEPSNEVPMEPMVSSLRDRVSSFGLDGLPTGFPEALPEVPERESDTLGSDESTLRAGNRDTVSSITNVAQRNVRQSGGLGRMKSLRQVARDHNNLTRHISSVAPSPSNRASGIIRRKSTKMFGANIVQVRPKPGSRLSTLEPIPQDEVPGEVAPKRQATFRIIRGELIGKGTYGRVYLGMNATTGEVLAVKQVEVNHKAAHHDKDKIKEMVAALDQEIDTMQHLEHANIVQYLGCERKEFAISIYLEYISGGSVGSCLRKHGKFEESVVRSLTFQTLSGLAYLHGEGILHRDLKADNILLDRDGTCKISDFGISKKSDNIYGNDITNSMQGSVFWMAPEVVRSQGQGYSAKVDVWSLGCVVLEMFAGRRPWSREEAIGAIFKLGSLNQAPPIPDDVTSTASLDGMSFMYDCFQTTPSERPTADTLLRESRFCKPDPYYNFYDTELADKLRRVSIAPPPSED